MSENMKPSGTNYLLDIPITWGIKRIKYCAEICNGAEYADIVVDEGGYPVMGSGGEFARASKFCYSKKSVLLGRKGTIDKPLFIDEPFWCVDTMFYTKMNKKTNAKFLYYCSLNIRFDYYVTSTALPSMTQRDLGSEKVAFPPFKEQTLIAGYLDKKCEKIDSIATDIEKQIELLQKYKKSLITETVTKGLDKNVPMKDSGVEWIGDIPESWEVKRLKFALESCQENIKVGPFGSSLTSSDYVDDGIWVYNQRTVLDDNFNDNETYISENKFKELRGFEVNEGDILITTRGTTGKVAIVPVGAEKGILHPCIIKFRINEDLIKPELVKLIFNESDFAQDQFTIMSNATTIDVIYSYSLKNIILPIIPHDEQNNIYSFLKSHCSKIDSIIESKKEQLATINNYKKSLIYEYVTGKKRVEGANNNGN